VEIPDKEAKWKQNNKTFGKKNKASPIEEYLLTSQANGN
jgi:hypothetical protein